jgi:integrase
MALAALAPSTITRAMTAIRTAHRVAGQVPPDTTLAMTAMRGYRRQEDTPRLVKAPPMLLPALRTMVDVCDPATASGVRDRAMIVLGWAMMARRSELAALNVGDVRVVDDGMEVTVQASKTDQDALGTVVHVPYGSHPETCPVRTVQAWMAAMGTPSGPLFRPVDRHGRMGGDPKFAGRSTGPRMTPQAVEVVIVRAAKRAGLPSGRKATGGGYTPHSLRSGAATATYRAGADPLAIARHGRWKEGSPVLLGYIRSVDKWEENPVRGAGL